MNIHHGRKKSRASPARFLFPLFSILFRNLFWLPSERLTTICKLLGKSDRLLLIRTIVVALWFTALFIPPVFAATIITTIDSEGDVGFDPSLVLSNNDKPIISYLDKTNSSLKVAVCSDTTCTINNTLTSVAVGNVDWYSSIKLNAQGYPVISYLDKTSNNLKLAVCGNVTCTVNNSFNPINNAGEGGAYSSLALNNQGYPVISYIGVDNNLKLAVCGNATCTVNNTLVNLGETIGWYLSLILDNQNSPVISYYSGNSLKLAKCGDNICSTKEFNIVDNIGDVGDSSSIVLNKQGYPVISYFDKTNTDLKLVTCGNATCTANNKITMVDDAGGADTTSGAGGFTSLVLNSQGYPVISYYDITNGNLKLATCGDATCTVGNITFTTIDGTTGDVGKYSSLALNNQGNPVIGYYDSTQGDLKLAVCDNPTCSPLPEIDLQGNNISIPNGATTPHVTDDTDFGSVNIGDTLTNTFTILNTGVITLNLTKVSLSVTGCDPFSMMPPPSFLEPNESTTFQVTFAPTNESTFNCTVNIDNNDSDENPYTFALTGKGQSTQPIPSPPPAQPLPPTMDLTINFGGTGHGHVTTDPSGIDCDSSQAKCSYSFNTATWINLKATPAANSKFTGWSGLQSDCDNGELFMSGPRSCTANFALLPHQLTVNILGQGKVNSNPTGIDCDSNCSHQFKGGEKVTLTAIPAQDWQFKEWQGDCDNTGQVVMDKDKKCQATFSQLQPPLVLPTINFGSMPLKLSSHSQTKKLRFMAPRNNFLSPVLQKNFSRLRSKLSDNTDLPLSVAIQQPPGLSTSVSPEEAARHFLAVTGKSFGFDDSTQLQLMKEQILPRDRSVVRFQQAYQDIPVLGGEVIVNMDAAKNVMSVSGEISPNLQNFDTTPTFPAPEASQIALAKIARDYQVDVSKLAVNMPELWIYDPAILGTPGPQINALVWRVEVIPISESLPIREVVLVEAHLGMVIFSYSEINHARNRIIYDNQNNSSIALPGSSPVLSEGGSCTTCVADVLNAYLYSGDTYQFYQVKHGRDSLDNSGMNLISTVRYCSPSDSCPFSNAFWNGSQMVYGASFASADDVVGHELTHGVTEHESHLFYFYQSGAINESFSDLWGEFIDQTNGSGNDDDSVKWRMGEDLSIGAIRNMANPPEFGDPDKMTSLLYNCNQSSLSKTPSGDGGGVHTNSGINNKAVYLMTGGGSFNGQTVTGLGIDKVASLYYEVQTNLLTSAADYADLYDALLQACVNLQYPATDCQQVKNALNAVEMNLQPIQCPANEALLCDNPNDIPVDIFFDNFESGSSHWTITGNIVGFSTPAWFVPQTASTIGLNDPYATSGIGNAWGFDQGTSFGGSSSTFLAMNSPTTSLPPNTFMHFKHSYGFDSNVPTASIFYDGGVLEYTTAGGSIWLDAGSLITTNGYNSTLTSTSNPLNSRQAFGADSRGYISSRVNLNSLTGQSMRFRFRIGTDQNFYDYGWFIDDVRIYSCQSVTDICATAIPWDGGSHEDTIVKNEGYLEIAGSITPIKVKALCNYGTIQEITGNLLSIQVDPTTGFIDNEGSILGKEGSSSTTKSTIPTTLVNSGDNGGGIKLRAGTQLYNRGTINAGNGGNGYFRAGNGGSVAIYADHIIQEGSIFAGNGGEGNAHQPAWDGFGSYTGDSTNISVYGNQPVWGGNGGRTVLQARNSLNTTATAITSSGNGGNAYVWCVNGAHLTDWEFDGRWYAGTCVSETTGVPVAVPTPGEGGDLIKISPTLNEIGTGTSGGGLYYEPNSINAGVDTHIEAKKDVVIFGGDDWVLDLRNLKQEAISTSSNITLAVGTSSTIDLRSNTSKIFKAGGQFTIFADTILLDDGISLESLVDAKGGIVTNPSKILSLVTLNGPGQITGEPQATLPIELELINGGPEADVYNLIVSDLAGWNLTVLPSSVLVEGLKRETLVLSIVLPAAKVGEKDTITITATSLADPTVSATTDITVTVEDPTFSPLPDDILSSTVYDQSGAPVAGATLTIGNETLTTDENGHWQIDNSTLTSGTLYDVQGNPLTGATIQLGDQTLTTDANGRWELTQPNVTGNASPDDTTAADPFSLLPPQTPACYASGLVDWVCNANGQQLTDLTVGPNGMMAYGTLVGTLTNQGWVSNLTLEPQSQLTGGIVTGYITNHGEMANFEFRGAAIVGGTLAGDIFNTSQIGGYFRNVQLAAGTHLRSGQLAGEISGEIQAPALLEDLAIQAGSHLQYVTIGDGVKLAAGVTLGEGVQFNHPSDDPRLVPKQSFQPVACDTQLPSLGVTVINAAGQVVETQCQCAGGVSVNGGSFEPTVQMRLTDTVEIRGTVCVAPEQLGQLADLVVYLNYQPLNVAAKEKQHYMLDSSGEVLPWDGQVAHLVAFQQTMLTAVQEVLLYQGQLATTGKLELFFGYRLMDGTLVSNEKAIEITITDK